MYIDYYSANNLICSWRCWQQERFKIANIWANFEEGLTKKNGIIRDWSWTDAWKIISWPLPFINEWNSCGAKREKISLCLNKERKSYIARCTGTTIQNTYYLAPLQYFCELVFWILCRPKWGLLFVFLKHSLRKSTYSSVQISCIKLSWGYGELLQYTDKKENKIFLI